jgi:hypothetical protein
LNALRRAGIAVILGFSHRLRLSIEMLKIGGFRIEHV